MSQLTEKEIIRAGLPYIRSHYKFRPRCSAIMETRYDVEASGGVIADGYLAFDNEDGEPFIVTVESTSFKTRDEVIYAIQNKLLNWDSLAITTIFLTGVYVYYNFHGYNVSQTIGSIPTIFLITSCFCLGLFLFRILLGWMRRYRYIYAIEQFKQYEATEQWIALGADVFSSHVDKDFIELKEQCVDNGFGLVMVNDKHEVQLLITPAREAVFANRQGLIIADQKQPISNLSFIEKGVKWCANKTRRIIKARPTAGLSRYRSGFYKQIVTIFLGLTIMTGIYYKEWMDSPIAYVDEDKYQRDQLVKAKNVRGERKGYLIEEENLHNWDSITGNYLTIEESIWEDDTKATSEIFYERGELLELDANPKTHNSSRTEIIVGNRDGVAASYDCERFYNFTGSLFLVQDGIYEDLTTAEQRLRRINKAGLDGNLLWLGCFGEGTKYVVYYQLMFPIRREAVSVAESVIEELKQKEIPYGTLKIRTLRKSTE